MTQIVAATCVLGPGQTGLTIGLRVLNLDGTTYSAFSTTGVAETSVPGTYRKANGVVAPDAGGYIVWGTSVVDKAEAAVDSSIMGKSPATLAAADVSGNLPVDVQTIKTQAVTAAAPVTVPASIGTSTYTGTDTTGTTELLTRIPDATPGTTSGLPLKSDLPAAAPSAAAIDTVLSGTHGSGAWGAGSGAFSKVYTVTVGGIPRAGAYCRMTTDLAGLVNISAGTSNSLGQVTFLHNLPVGTPVWIHVNLDGFLPLVDQETI